MNVLEQLYEEDKKDRLSSDWDDQKNPEYQKKLRWLKRRDVRRRKRVLQFYSQGRIKTSKDFYHAALILQHGENSNDYKLANEFAKKAMDAGLEKPKWLYAATLDRLLLSQGKPQKFGTQFEMKNGWWKLAPVDKSTTDEERAKYNVPPLKYALKRFQEKYTN